MAAADIHNVNIVVGQKVEVQVPVSDGAFLKRRKVTAVGTDEVTLGTFGVISSNKVEVLEHHDNEPVTSGDWASTQ